jgi:hypothetical protein
MMNPMMSSLNLGRARFAVLPLSKPMTTAVWLALLVVCRSQPVPRPSTDVATETMEQRLRDGRDRANAEPRRAIAAELHITGGDVVAEKIEINSVDLPDAIQQLGKQAGFEVQIDPALLHQQAADGTPLPSPSVTIAWKNVTALQAMEALLENYGWRMERTPHNPKVRILGALPNAVDPRMTKVDLFENAPGNHAGGDVLCDINLNNVDLPEAIRALAIQARLNIQFDPLLANPQDAQHHPIPSPQVTETWKNVTARQVIQKLLDKYGWQMAQLPGNPILHIGAKALEAMDLR